MNVTLSDGPYSGEIRVRRNGTNPSRAKEEYVTTEYFEEYTEQL